ncbi:MAG: toxic anion resistance protein [Oscillospiraceae bacterium]|nr:toxic anion resistance protein [Oscillospiraceae bacterium]MDD6503763.1 toxic anion resistance protein [Oscillospiraceae bacterium]MDY4104781.1 toxic anion resistance protein [Oscillospiraceae bacterium]
MSDEYIPTLTLDPNAGADASAAAIPAVEEPAPEEAKDIPVEKIELSKFSEQEQAAIRQFAGTIDITNSEQVMNYGAAAQKNISDFSGAALNSVRTKDLGEMGDMLSDLVIQLKSMDFDGKEEKKGFKGLFKKARTNIDSLKAQYDRVEVNVDKIAASLSGHERTLLKDVAMLDKMYEKNQAYYKELTMYILAGKIRLEQLRTEELPKLQAKAEASGLPEDAQAASDFASMIGRFEKRIYDLELTRMISLQMAPQIRMIQNNDTIMAEKIQTSLVNTIPLWKSQMVLALTMHHSKQAMEAQREVSDVTNELLKKNAEALHQGSVSIAKEAERGIVEIETLKKTNQELIASLEEVRQIQEDGRAKRAQAEEELGRIEGELKQKLLDLRG